MTILIVKYRAIGDSIALLPMAKAFHDAGCIVDVLCHGSNKAVFFGQKCIRKTIFPSGKLLLPKQYDLVIDAEPWSNLSALLARWVGRRAVGFAFQRRSKLYDVTIAYDRSQHITQTYMDIPRALGVQAPIHPVLLPLSTTAADIDAAKVVTGDAPYVVFAVGVGCAGRYRRWASRRWAQLAAKTSGAIVWTGHGRDDAADVAEVFALLDPKTKSRSINAVGALTLSQTAAAIKSARCFVGCDSGPMHISASMGTPTVGLFGPNTPTIWAPLGVRCKSLWHKNPGVPCIINDTMDFFDDAGWGVKAMDAITVDEVINTMAAVLK